MITDDHRRQLSEQGYCVVPGVIDRARAEDVRLRLWAAADESERRGAATRNVGLDPNEHNVRVFNLIDLDPVFIDLVRHPAGIDLVQHLIGPGFLISNFTANIALPGSGSMSLHSDQSIVIPEPWLAPWTINIIWCITDVRADNGATRFIPGSHRWTCRADIPADAESLLQPFEAPAGSIIAMDGRTWHTSGCNITADEERAMLFGYYSNDFIRPQQNWNAALSQATIDGLDDQMRIWLGLPAEANIRLAMPLLEERSEKLTMA